VVVPSADHLGPDDRRDLGWDIQRTVTQLRAASFWSIASPITSTGSAYIAAMSATE
jgi:hypothetical protein